MPRVIDPSKPCYCVEVSVRYKEPTWETKFTYALVNIQYEDDEFDFDDAIAAEADDDWFARDSEIFYYARDCQDLIDRFFGEDDWRFGTLEQIWEVHVPTVNGKMNP